MVVGVTRGRILLKNAAEYRLIDNENAGQYAWIEFAEEALPEQVNHVPDDVYQQSVALAKMMELWV